MSTGQRTGSAVAIESLHPDAKSLGPEEFEARHGRGFLLGSSGTKAPNDTTSTAMFLGFEEDPNARTANVATVVYPIRCGDGSDGPLVTIGRQARHDVVIPDKSISRFHAFAKREGGEFLIDGRNAANVELEGFIAANRLNFSLLQKTQELHLHGLGRLTNLIEENSSVIRFLKEAFLVDGGSCKGAANVPKHFALEQGLSHRTAVYRDKFFA